jgi:uncharacterized membrane protein YfcA
MMLDTIQYLLGAASGILVGFVLGLVGGGGSILAVPMMVYLVGVPNPHVAIGTSALAVAVNAATGLANHVRAGTVKWRCALVFAASGVAGAFAGSSAGKAFDGQKLLFLFAIVMLVVGVMMLRNRGREGDASVVLGRENGPKLVGYGLGTGLFSGFFGIGGGFLVVPGLVAATRMPMINAIGSSLVAVTAFGLTTAANYAFSGLVDWLLAAAFIAGGIAGGFFGARVAKRLAGTQGRLTTVFAGLIFVVAAYMLWKSAQLGAGIRL